MHPCAGLRQTSGLVHKQALQEHSRIICAYFCANESCRNAVVQRVEIDLSAGAV